MKVKSESEVAQSCLTLRDPMDCSLPGSSIHGLFQARVLEWGAIAFSGLNLKGLQILPGLIDPDYSGKIKVMAFSLSLIHSMSFLKVSELLSSFSCLITSLTILIVILSPEENKDLGAQVIKECALLNKYSQIGPLIRLKFKEKSSLVS